MDAVSRCRRQTTTLEKPLLGVLNSDDGMTWAALGDAAGSEFPGVRGR